LKPDNSLTDNQQRNPGDKVEYDENDLEASEKRIDHHVKGLPWNRKPSVLDPINKIRRQEEKDSPENQQRSVDDGAPHEKACHRLNIHRAPHG
jgi:hypothetical protein